MKSNIVSNTKSLKFYFQQRHGSLDIRSISRIDIQKIISEVDIDTLQSCIENITFSTISDNDLRLMTDPLILKTFKLSQLLIEYLLFAQEELLSQLARKSEKYSHMKRDLLYKRNELVALQESCDHLTNLVDTKRKRIKSLESLLKDATSKRNRKHVSHYIVNDQAYAQFPLEPNRSPTVEVKPQQTLAQPDNRQANITERATSPIQLARSPEIKEVKRSDDSTLLLLMTERWNKLETSLRGQIESQLLQQEIKLQSNLKDINQKRLQFGGIESDSDDVPEKIEDTAVLVEPFVPLKNNMPPMSNAVNNEEIEYLRKALEAKNREIAMLQQVSLSKPDIDRNDPVPLKPNIEVDRVKALPVIDRLPDKLSNAIPSYEADDVEEMVLNEEPIKPVASNQKVEKSTPNTSYQPINHEATDNVVKPSSSTTIEAEQLYSDQAKSFNSVKDDYKESMREISDNMIHVIFRPDHNPEIELFNVNMLSVAFSSHSEPSSDDIVFEIRRSIAQQLKLPLAKVKLLLEDKVVTIGLDIEDDPLTLEETIGLAEEGILRLQIQYVDQMTDAQLDSMVSSWQNRNPDVLKASFESTNESMRLSQADWPLPPSEEPSIYDRNSMEFTNAFTTTRSYNDYPMRVDDNEYQNATSTRSSAAEESLLYTRMRKTSIENEMSEIENESKMSDSEFANKMAALMIAKSPKSTELPPSHSGNTPKIIRSGDRAYQDEKSIDSGISYPHRQQFHPTKLHNVYESDDSFAHSFTEEFTESQNYDSADDTVTIMSGEPNLSLASTAASMNKQSKSRYESYDEDDSRQSVDMEAQIKKKLPKTSSFKESSVEYLERKLSGVDIFADVNKDEANLDDMAAFEKTGTESAISEFDSLGSGTGTSPILRGNDTHDWNCTVTTELGSRFQITPVKSSDIMKRADDYERHAAEEMLYTTPFRGGETMDSIMQSKASTNASFASPFQTLNDGSISEGHLNSLALSDSVMDDLDLSQSTDLR